ncbi:hypothetical protein B0H10DRAFT_1967125 [Mycena sp. CBHHK59/15]|nr:hypothetical protein B0H10DRAFT_1967125 [Mycena sp. CBHHK59/15]
MDIVRNDNKEEQDLVTEWDPSDWILCGKKYKDVPQIVEVAQRSILRLLTSIQHHLPSKTMTISQLLNFDMPPLADDNTAMDDDTKSYSASEPTANIEEILASLALPNHILLQKIIDRFGQAWFNSKKSLHTWLHPEIRCPFWAMTYWGEMIDVCEAKDAWLHADVWLKKRGKKEEETTMKHTVYGLWSVAAWHGSLHGFGSLTTLDLAKFFSEDYLEGSIVNVMLALLLLHSTGSRYDTLIVNTTFARFIFMLLPIVDGKAVGPITSSPGAQRYLKKYGEWFQSPDHSHLHIVLYQPIKHWTACSINFQDHQIQYSDLLGWTWLEDFFTGLKVWIDEYQENTEFTVTDDLPCAVQTDGHNCPIIAVNTVGLRALGDPLWTPENTKAMCMKAFCDILKYVLSAKCSAMPKTPLVDPSDLFMASSSSGIEVQAMDYKLTTRSPLVPASILQVNRPVKRVADEMDDVEEPVKKLTKTMDVLGQATPPFLTSDCNNANSFNLCPTAKPSASKAKKTDGNSKVSSHDGSGLVVGVSKSAHAARMQRAAVKNSTFKASAVKLENFKNKCHPKIRMLDQFNLLVPVCPKPNDLDNNQKEHIVTAQLHDRTWRNDTSPGIMASFATNCLKTVKVNADSTELLVPCQSCLLVHTSQSYHNAINKPAADSKKLCFVPCLNQNLHAGMLYARFKGLEALDNTWSLECCYFQYVVNREFKDDTVFNGIVEAKVLGTFLVGIQDATFDYAQKYCEDYKYPLGAPLSIAVDDTKLFSALSPLYDGVKQKWFIDKTTGDPIEVPSSQEAGRAGEQCRDGDKASTLDLADPTPWCPAIAPCHYAHWLQGTASKHVEFRIKHPDPDYPDIIVVIWELNGNIWVEWNDTKHGPNTFQNNTFSGAYEDGMESGLSEITEQTAVEELQSMIDGLKNVVNISWCGDEELDACVMASVALSMDELAKIEDLPESDPECFTEIQKDIAHAMATQPAVFIALLQGIAESRPKLHSDANAVVPELLPSSSKPLIDVSADDLSPFVALWWEHQTQEAKMGVRPYKSSATYKTPKTGIEKPLSDWQKLAQEMQAIRGTRSMAPVPASIRPYGGKPTPRVAP